MVCLINFYFFSIFFLFKIIYFQWKILEHNHEGILLDIGWQTILSRAKSQLIDIQRPAVTLIANLALNGFLYSIIFKISVFLIFIRIKRGKSRHDYHRRRS